MKAFIIHRWGGNPDEGLYKWLASELESRGFEVIVPEMPDTDNPQINSWVNKIKEICQDSDENTYFFGHSIGCQTILRYLETLPEDVKVGKVVLIAPWLHLQGIEEEEGAAEVAEPWLITPIDFEKVKSHANFTCIFSDNDPYVPISDKDIFKENLNAQIIVEHDKGHFTEEDGVKELPSALNSI